MIIVCLLTYSCPCAGCSSSLRLVNCLGLPKSYQPIHSTASKSSRRGPSSIHTVAFAARVTLESSSESSSARRTLLPRCPAGSRTSCSPRPRQSSCIPSSHAAQTPRSAVRYRLHRTPQAWTVPKNDSAAMSPTESTGLETSRARRNHSSACCRNCQPAPSHPAQKRLCLLAFILSVLGLVQAWLGK